MKKTIQTISLLLFTMLIVFSCKKSNNENVTPTLSTLQHNWTIDSIVVFDNAGFNGGGIKWDGSKDWQIIEQIIKYTLNSPD